MNFSEPPPLVSICIPAFNAASWLPSTLESVLAQTYPNIEIIVIDDGSIDDTPSIAHGFAARGVRAVSQRNAGTSAARNHALRLAHGDYIKFLDADDLISSTTIQSQVESLHGHPGHLAHGIWARFVTSPSEAQFTPHPGWHDSASAIDWICETWSDAEPMYQCALFLIPRRLLERAGGWNESLSLIDDFEFFTRLILVSDGIRHTPDARIYYRSRIPGSLSARKTRHAWESARRSIHLACTHLLSREDSPRTRRIAAAACMNLVFELYPNHPDLVTDLLGQVRSLGGSQVQPGGGRVFRLLSRTIGWRTALHLRRALNDLRKTPKQ